MSGRDLNRLIARLSAEGLEPLIRQLQSGQPFQNQIELSFGSLAKAKAIQRLLYGFLWFYPMTKASLSLRLSTETGTLYLMPKGISEKRGRKGSKG